MSEVPQPPQAAVSSADDDDPPPPSLCEFQEVKTILDNVSLSTESLRKGYDALTEALYGIDNLELQLLEHADNAKSGLSQAVIKLKATEAALEVEAETLEQSAQQPSASHKMRRKGWLANNVRLVAYIGRLMEVQESGMTQRVANARRQYRVVAPHATEEEIDLAMAASGGAGASALASSSEAHNRAGKAIPPSGIDWGKYLAIGT